MAQEYHPDRGGMGDAEYMSLLKRAKDILFDPKKKAAFDVIYRAKVSASRPRPW
jgi:curved DNA-binding protein CbpA